MGGQGVPHPPWRCHWKNAQAHSTELDTTAVRLHTAAALTYILTTQHKGCRPATQHAQHECGQLKSQEPGVFESPIVIHCEQL